MRIFCAVIVVTLIFGTHGQFISDPCDPKEYHEVDDAFRSTGFMTEPPHTPKCDNSWDRGWYRFINHAGGEMPTTCQETNKCGTTRPIWLAGPNPNATDGIVMRHICINMNNSDPTAPACCEDNEEIFMKNCTGFYVYFLYPIRKNCPKAYCAGHIPPCPVGKWSKSDFPPCRDLHPVMDFPPTVLGPNINADKSLDFRCQINFAPNDTDQVFEVTWTFNGVPDPGMKPVHLTGGNKTAFLYGSDLKGRMENKIGCQVQSYYEGRVQDIGPVVKSNETYFGLTSRPILSGPFVRNGSFEFQCEVINDMGNAGQEFEVDWTFDGREEPSLQQIIISPNTIAILDGKKLKGHLNKVVGCEVRLIYTGSARDVKSSFRKSTSTYYAGIQFSPSKLVMSKADFEKYVTVTSTVPLICEDDLDCCLTFRTDVSQKLAVNLKDACEYKMCSSHWNENSTSASIQVGIIPTRSVMIEGTKQVDLTFQGLVSSGNSSNESYLDIFNGTNSLLQVEVNDELSYRCSISGDPHIQTFEGRRFDLYHVGDYRAYVAKNRDFEVQISTAPCGHVTCLCGVVAREGNDVIKVDTCYQQPAPRDSPVIHVAHNLSEGTTVRRSSNGMHFGIHFVSGSEVSIDVYTNSMSLYISTPAFDKGQAWGLCGTNDGDPDNALTHPDGTVDRITCSSVGYRCLAEAFYEAWRVNGTSSMFQHVPDLVVRNTTSQIYCSCLENANGSPVMDCSPMGHVHTPNTACTNCLDITETLKPSYTNGVGWPQDGTITNITVPVTVKPFDPNKQWPNDDGVTETQGHDKCMGAMQKSQLYTFCQNQTELISITLSDCMEDILYGGGTEVLDTVTSIFTSKCQDILATDPNYYQQNTTHLVLKPEILNVCPVECFKHGNCGQNGRCVCETGWEGDTCHIESGKGPQMHHFKGGDTCDTAKENCEKIYIDVSNINLSALLQCRMQPIDEQGNSVGSPIVAMAEVISPTKIACVLPAVVLQLSSQRYKISATNDGSLFGNFLILQVFDSTCLDCDVNGCKSKSSACHIDNHCYKNGASEIKVCDVSKSTSKWTMISATDFYNSLQAPPTSASVPLVPNSTLAPLPNDTVKACQMCFP